MTTAAAAPLTLQAIADAINVSRALSLADVRNAYVDNIGGGVYAVLDYAGNTITINGGRRSVDVATDGPADVLVCLDGAQIGEGTATTAAEVAVLFRDA